MNNFISRLKTGHYIGFLFLLNSVYFFPNYLGKGLYQHDADNLYLQNREIKEYYEKTGEIIYWNSKTFAGMPFYFGQGGIGNQLLLLVLKPTSLGIPLFVWNSFLTMLFLFLLVRYGFQTNGIWALLAAIAFGFSTYSMDILKAGHFFKIYTIYFSFVLILGLLLVFRQKKFLWGGIITVLGTTLVLAGKHYQVTFYIFISLLIYGLVELIFHYKRADLKSFFQKTFLILGCGIIGLGLNTKALMADASYTKQSIRGKTDLIQKGQTNREGLNLTYAFAWSFEFKEVLSLFIPRIYGGASQEVVSQDSDLYKAIAARAGKKQADNFIQQVPTYWGEQPFVGAPLYIGILALVLLVLAFPYLPKVFLWWFIPSSILAIMMAMGNHLMWFNQFLYENFPLFNKFRAVSTNLVVFMILLTIFGFVAVDRMMKTTTLSERQAVLKKRFKYVAVGFGAIFLLVVAFYSFQGNGRSDAYFSQIKLLDELISVRKSFFYTDWFKALLIATVVGYIVFKWDAKGKSQPKFFLGLIALGLFDVCYVSTNYFSYQNFIDQKQKERQKPSLTAIDREILQDTSYYRVLNTNVSTMSDATTSYFHYSLGGYNPAKLRRYQELWDEHMAMGKINPQVLNMLNTKYLITQQNQQPKLIKNKDAYGNAWIVDSLVQVHSANEEIDALKRYDLAKIAVVDKSKFDLHFEPNDAIDSTRAIYLVKYHPHQLEYQFQSTQNQMVVFSEIFYPNDWELWVDDKTYPISRVNYVLRGAVIPKGKHKVTLKFNYNTLKKGETLEYFFAGFSILSILVIFGLRMKQKQKLF